MTTGIFLGPVEAGWYDDPVAMGDLRWWDGARWGVHIHCADGSYAQAEPSSDWPPPRPSVTTASTESNFLPRAGATTIRPVRVQVSLSEVQRKRLIALVITVVAIMLTISIVNDRRQGRAAIDEILNERFPISLPAEGHDGWWDASEHARHGGSNHG
jgi:hypothetical protein